MYNLLKNFGAYSLLVNFCSLYAIDTDQLSKEDSSFVVKADPFEAQFFETSTKPSESTDPLQHSEPLAETTPAPKLEREPKPEFIGIRHTEGKGLGYSKGYSSLDLFISQPFSRKLLVPFLDLRGHVFNNGKYAANAGIGFRGLSERYKQIWGFNAFYDYYQSSQRIYNQVSLGLEALGNNWDACINGYLPVGHKKTNIYRFSYGGFSTLGFEMSAREQFAMKGFDSDFGYRFCKTRLFDFHVGAGPYYYWGTAASTKNVFNETTRHAIGGRVRAEMSFMNYVFAEGYVGYDSLFRWTGQGTLSLRFPFNLTYRSKGSSPTSYCLKERLYRPVERNEIVVVKSITRVSTNPDILDPEFNP